MQFHSYKAIYLQIADLFFDQILRRKLLPGDRIPSVRELAAELEVTPNTVQRAYLYLQDKGVIFNKRGIGYFVAENAFDISHKIKLEEFINKELPVCFRQLDALGLDFDQLKKIYENFKSQEHETKKESE